MSKKLIFIIIAIFIISIQAAYPAEQTSDKLLALPQVDTRTELLSIVFRLAGNHEYNISNFKEYVRDVDEYFGGYKNHEAVRYAQEMREQYGVSYDAVAAISFHLEPIPSLKPKTTFTDEAFSRWGGAENALKFVALLQKFAADTRCEEFFRMHEQLYALAEERFRHIYDSVDVDWFISFYGTKPTGKLNIIVGFGNGPCNYGPKVLNADKTEDCYAVMGTWSFDSLGKPQYSAAEYLPLIIHEFNHSFVNHINEKNEKAFEPFSTNVFEQVKYNMQRQAYPTPICMLNETLVRACVVQYLKSHDSDNGKTLKEEIQYQIGTGFIWIANLGKILDSYESNRAKYTTLESFVPDLVEFYKWLSENPDQVFGKCPHVTSVEPFANNSDSARSETKEMRIHFDKPLAGSGFSIWRSQSEGTQFPIDGQNVRYKDGNKTLVLGLAMNPKTKYEFILVGTNFKSLDGYPLLDYVVSFQTK